MWQWLPSPFQKKSQLLVSFAVVLPHSATPQSTENTLMGDNWPWEEHSGGQKTAAQPRSAAAAQQRGLFSSLSRDIDASSLEEVVLQREESSQASFLPESLRTYHWEESLTADRLPHSERRQKNPASEIDTRSINRAHLLPKCSRRCNSRIQEGNKLPLRKCAGVKSDNCFLCIICLEVKQTNVFIWPRHSLKSCR